MSEQEIICPNCKHHIPLSEALSSQLEEKIRMKLETENDQSRQAILAEKENLEKEKREIEHLKKSIDEEVEKKTSEERVKMEQEKQDYQAIAEKKAEQALALQLKDLESQNKEKEAELEKAQHNELELMKRVREVEAEKKNVELEVQRKIEEERGKISDDVRKELDDLHRLKLAEKEKQMDQMKRTIDDLKRKSEQGSMQIQGDVQENDLKMLIKSSFPTDSVEDVSTGIKGGDLIQKVCNQFGVECGIILWESKNTKNWSKDWLTKAKQDQGLAKADIALLVSRVMPEGCSYFASIDGVWVCEYTHVLPLVSALRIGLQDVFKAKQSSKGKDEKMENLYQYLSSSQFSNRIENIVQAFSGMKSDLDKERNAMQRIWKKREQEIERVIGNTACMYGDLQGIVGATALPEVPSLSLPEGEADETETALF